MLLGLGSAWLARGSPDQAVAFISKASDLDPEDPAPYLFLGRIQAVEKISRDEILARLKRFVALHPENADANYYYAVGLWKQQSEAQSAAQTAQVEALLNTAIRLNPKFTAACVQLGMVRDAQRDLRGAIAEYKKAIQSGADSDDGDVQLQEAHYRLAQSYRRAGDVEAAKAESEIYQRMVKASQQQSERERHEILQFVYTLRDPATPRQIPQ